MSAFIIGKETMDKVIEAIHGQFINTPGGSYTFAGVDVNGHGNSLDKLGRALYSLNLDAVCQRYPGDTQESAPGPCDISNIHGGYIYNPSKTSDIENLKAVRCLVYQCSEGDVPDQQAYKELERVRDNIEVDLRKLYPYDFEARLDRAAWD